MVRASHKNYSCRLLTEADWLAYKHIQLLTHVENNDPERLAQDSERSEQSWREELCGDIKIFGLFHGCEIIGDTTVKLLPGQHAVKFNGSYISTLHRSKGLADMLYAARFDYVAGLEGFDHATTEIWQGNTKSRAAAERNGFVNTGVYADPQNPRSEGRSFIYQRSLKNIATPPVTPARTPKVS